MKRTVGVLVVLWLSAIAPANAALGRWSAEVVSELLKQRDEPEPAIVAIVCSAQVVVDLELDRLCETLRQELADGMIDRGMHVVVPWRSFALIDSWDHVDCGDGPSDLLGWNLLEIAVSHRARSRGLVVDVLDSERGNLLHSIDLTPQQVDGLDRETQDTWSAPFEISRERDREIEVVSHLARMLICGLKSLPVKSLLSEVVVYGDIDSPAQGRWAQRVGVRLITSINQVLRSGYFQHDTTTLELEIVAVRPGFFRLVPRILGWQGTDADDQPVLLVDGSMAPEDRVCLVRQRGELSTLLGDLRVFGNDVAALERYIERRGMTLALERVPSDMPVGWIVEQDPPEGTIVRHVPHNLVGVRISDGPVTAPPSGIDDRIELIGNAFGIDPATIHACRVAAADSPELRAELEQLIRQFDPLDPQGRARAWRRWYEFAHPRYLPNFPASPANRFVRAVSDRLFATLEQELFVGGAGQ